MYLYHRFMSSVYTMPGLLLVLNLSKVYLVVSHINKSLSGQVMKFCSKKTSASFFPSSGLTAWPIVTFQSSNRLYKYVVVTRSMLHRTHGAIEQPVPTEELNGQHPQSNGTASTQGTIEQPLFWFWFW